MMFHAMNGLGQDASGEDTSGTIISETGGIQNPLPTLNTVNLPGAAFINPTTGLYTDYSGVTTSNGLPSPVTGSPSTGFNWGILASIIPSLASTAGQTTASVLNAQTNAQTAASLSAAQIAASQASSASSSSLMMLGLAAAAVVLVVVMARGKH